MAQRLEYRKKADQYVIAIQLDLETSGFSYKKWGGVQICQRGDWVVNNGGDVYTIADESFKKTYEEIAAGRYRKTASVWASVAEKAGTVNTKEGSTDYLAGDYIVFNDQYGHDAYAVSKKKFEAMYELCPGATP